MLLRTAITSLALLSNSSCQIPNQTNYSNQKTAPLARRTSITFSKQHNTVALLRCLPPPSHTSTPQTRY
ncbi:hypothetical protein D6D08_09414, partial [Aureobasidium pullulans]